MLTVRAASAVACCKVTIREATSRERIWHRLRSGQHVQFHRKRCSIVLCLFCPCIGV